MVRSWPIPAAEHPAMNTFWAAEQHLSTGFSSIGTCVVNLWRTMAQAYLTHQQQHIMSHVDARLRQFGL